ncbi:hypothetical protein ACA910_006707 [Epithemia clementina (nom. ined.)]
MFHSLGCPRNFVDTELMLGLSVHSGLLQITQSMDEADYLVVNTCGFLESARQEAKDVIQELIEAKRPQSKLIVTGCMVNLHKDQILNDYPQVDSVLGAGSIDKIVDTIRMLESVNSNEDFTSTSTTATTSRDYYSPRAERQSFLAQGDTPRVLATPPHYAYIKIAEGCKKQCSFCIIPKIKGKLQSKPLDQIVGEFQVISQRASEIILIAQDLGDYGKDLQQTLPLSTTTTTTHDNQKVNLASLLKGLLSASDDPDLWLRLMYLYPDEITPEIVDIMEADSRICRYLDMPIQHSHNDMLRLMRRKTSAEEIKSTIRTLRQRLPGMHIRTSLMVGFPGETEEHFEHLLDFVREMELENVGAFIYSNEARAMSSRLPNHVPDEIKEERYDRLMQTQWEIVQRKQEAMRHSRLHVVIEGLNSDGNVVGRYYGQCPDIDGQVILPEERPKQQQQQPLSQQGKGRRKRGGGKNNHDMGKRIVGGQRYWVEITGYDEYDLVGKIVEGEHESLSAAGRPQLDVVTVQQQQTAALS